MRVEHWQADMNNSDNIESPLRILRLARSCTAPVIIHDSLGVSRAAAVVAAEICICQLLRGPMYKVKLRIFFYLEKLKKSTKFSILYNKPCITFARFVHSPSRLLCNTYSFIELLNTSFNHLPDCPKAFKWTMHDGLTNVLNGCLSMISVARQSFDIKMHKV